MSTEGNRIVVRRYFAELLNNGNLQVATKILTKDFIFHNPGAAPVTGIDAFKACIAKLHTAFPDLHFTPEQEIVEKDRVAGRFSFTATHKGEYAGIPPTGKAITVRGVDIFYFKGAKISEVWVYMDRLEMMMQMGVVPSRPE